MNWIGAISSSFYYIFPLSNPNFEDLRVHWKPTKPDAPCYLSINEDLQMVDDQLHSEKYKFWDNIKKQFQNKH